MLNNFLNRSFVLLVMFGLLTLTGCAGSNTGGGIFNKPLVYQMPNRAQDAQRARIEACVQQVSKQRVKQGKVGIIVQDEPTHTEERLARLKGKAVTWFAYPVAAAIAIGGTGAQIDREKNEAEAQREINRCLASREKKSRNRKLANN